jgi:2-methylcitrate dehydratase PrpD
VNDPRYRTAFLDWLGCAAGGAAEPAARAARATGDLVLALGAAGHVLDFDDTYAPGLAHLSAAAAPAALAVAAQCGATLGQALAAYAEGFEAMGAVVRASHPALYDRGWHPTAVCGVVGAAVAAAALLGVDPQDAVAIALLRAGGLRAAFGSDGKALQVGMAAASGVLAARLAAAGASVPLDEAAHGAAGFEAVFGASFAARDAVRAIDGNWIKAWPCCLQTHGPIEAALRAREQGVDGAAAVEVTVHPVSLQAAAYGPQPDNGLQAKFSIPYCVALTLLDGAPTITSFAAVDARAAAFAARGVHVRVDAGLGESEALLRAAGEEIRVSAALGSPERPLDEQSLAAKLRSLAGDRLDGALDDLEGPASDLVPVATCGWTPRAAVW